MEKRKYYFNAFARRLQTFPDHVHFKLFVGQCHVLKLGWARHLDDIIRHYFKPFTESQKEFLLKKYDEYMITELLQNWRDPQSRLTAHRLMFLYDKIKFKKVMRLNIGFNEVDFLWPVMEKVFDVIFTTSETEHLTPCLTGLPPELKKYIIDFCKEVKATKELIK